MTDGDADLSASGSDLRRCVARPPSVAKTARVTDLALMLPDTVQPAPAGALLSQITLRYRLLRPVNPIIIRLVTGS